MRVLVCGGQDYEDQWAIMKELRKLPRSAVLVHAGGQGAPAVAATGWERLGRRVEYVPSGTSMTDVLSNPVDLVLAFPGDLDTDQTISAALAAGVPVMNVEMLTIVAQVYGTTSIGMGL